MSYTIKITALGDKLYYLNNVLHREDGPAMETANGRKYWYINGKLHRVDGPSIDCPNGTKLWFKNGLLRATVRQNAHVCIHCYHMGTHEIRSGGLDCIPQVCTDGYHVADDQKVPS